MSEIESSEDAEAPGGFLDLIKDFDWLKIPGAVRAIAHVVTGVGDAGAAWDLAREAPVAEHAAALEDFRYSNPMKRANLVWDENNLREYIRDPQAKVKGNRMPYGGLTDGDTRRDIIAYLKILQ